MSLENKAAQEAFRPLSEGEQIKFMRLALKEAKKAEALGEIPVGAVLVQDGKVIAKAHNRRLLDSDPTAHAEVLTLRKAGKKLGVWNLSGCDLFVTLEPCGMCGGAIVNARIRNLYFGAFDKRFGYCGSLYNIASDNRLNHRAQVLGGILENECAELLTEFFKSKRNKNKNMTE